MRLGPTSFGVDLETLGGLKLVKSTVCSLLHPYSFMRAISNAADAAASACECYAVLRIREPVLELLLTEKVIRKYIQIL